MLSIVALYHEKRTLLMLPDPAVANGFPFTEGVLNLLRRF